jgi:hypothetical protein
MTQEEFDNIPDLRLHLAFSTIDRTTDCLHYLGDDAQRHYYSNGWFFYRRGKIIGQHPPINGRYLVLHKSGKVDFADWNDTCFNKKDNLVTDWQPLPKPPRN